MSTIPENAAEASPLPPDSDRPGQRVFLAVVDNTEEMPAALRYAARRASRSGGRLALLHVVETGDFRNFMNVGDLIREEARSEGEVLLSRSAAHAYSLTGQNPILYMREGNPVEELLNFLESEDSISVLVLAAGTSGNSPGPLIDAVFGKHAGRIRIPVTIVPGNLDVSAIDALT